jgi:hypothetical protein
VRSTRPQQSRSVCSGNPVLCARKYGFVGCCRRCEQLLVATRSSFSKGTLQNDIRRFESYIPSQPVRSLLFDFRVWVNRRHSRTEGTAYANAAAHSAVSPRASSGLPRNASIAIFESPGTTSRSNWKRRPQSSNPGSALTPVRFPPGLAKLDSQERRCSHRLLSVRRWSDQTDQRIQEIADSERVQECHNLDRQFPSAPMDERRSAI